MKHILIYITCADAAEAEKIAASLVEKRLVACANILPGHRSVYWWDGGVRSGAETAVLLKTRGALFEEVRAAVCALHSYETPCIVAWEIDKGHAPFLEWIENETGPARRS